MRSCFPALLGSLTILTGSGCPVDGQTADAGQNEDAGQTDDWVRAGLISIPSCEKPCAAVEDCFGTSPTQDGPENWSCDNDTCRWLGCASTDECNADFDEVCTGVLGEGTVPSCNAPCETTEDCTSTLFPDAFEFECIDGGCEQQISCTEASCDTIFGTDSVCHEGLCVFPCETPADCASDNEQDELRDENNYACTSGLCEYLGCQSDAECDAAFTSDRVCAAP